MNKNSKLSRPAKYLAVLVLTLSVGIPAALAHNGAFTDVPHGPTPEGSILHQSANAMKDAGITAGCGNNQYCPNDVVTRGQMAIFLKRGLSTVDRESASGSLPFAEDATILDSAEVTVPVGSDAAQFVKVDAKVEIGTLGTPCDCSIELFITDGTGEIRSDGSSYQFNASSVTTQTMTDSWVFESSGGDQEFFLFVNATDNDDETTATFNSDFVRIISTTYPFGSMEPGHFPESESSTASSSSTSSRRSSVDIEVIKEAIKLYDPQSRL